MSTAGNSSWERRTWPEMKRLATEVPEAGIHELSESKPTVVVIPAAVVVEEEEEGEED